jgi:hypothetical protein
MFFMPKQRMYHRYATHVDIFLRRHHPNVTREATLRSLPSNPLVRPQWGTILHGDLIFEIRDMVCGGFRMFDFLLGEAYMAATSKDETSFSSSIRMSARDLIDLTAHVQIDNTKFFLHPKSLNVDRPRSDFLWSEYLPTKNANVLGTYFLMKGVGRGGGIRVYEESRMHHIGLMDGSSKPATEVPIQWLFVRAPAFISHTT